MDMLICRLLFIAFLLHLAVGTDDSPLLRITQGEIKGVYQKSRDGKTYSAFMGIPYANKPEMFELAEPASKWNGVKDATKFGSVCPQFSPFKKSYIGQEDCLFVNVFTKNTKGNFSVMIFIHGGGFSFGNSDENGPDYFMDEEVVLVTINYRVTALGFLSMGDEILPGNLGLKDQLLALKWAKENVRFFGGDPGRVTLFGESAGAASVSYHILSPASNDLFQFAICQSGTSLNLWASVSQENAKKAALTLAEKLHCPIKSIELKKCLKSKSAEEIVQNSVLLLNDPLDNAVVFGPTVELPSDHAIITEHPEVLYKSGRFNKIPLVLSVCEKEGLLINAGLIMKNEEMLSKINDKWMEVAPKYFLYDDPTMSQDDKDVISKRIKKFYFGNKTISQETFENLTNLYSDSYFIYEVRNTALLHGKHAPVYTVVLAYEGYHWSQLMHLGYEKPMGITHADDLAFIFNDEKYPKFVPKSEAEAASKIFVKAWVTMATHGNPNHDLQLEGWNPVTENEIKNGKLKWLLVKSTPKVVVEPIGDRMRFWDKVSKKLKAKPNKESKREEL